MYWRCITVLLEWSSTSSTYLLLIWLYIELCVCKVWTVLVSVLNAGVWSGLYRDWGFCWSHVAQFQYRPCLTMKKALYVPISKEEFKKSQKGRKKQHHLIGPHVWQIPSADKIPPPGLSNLSYNLSSKNRWADLLYCISCFTAFHQH